MMQIPNLSGFAASPAAGEEQAKRPIETISWFDAVYFCNTLTQKVMGEADCVYTITGITRDPATKKITAATVTADWNKKGFRLPTEAEWEYAAMGGNTTNKWAGTDEEAQLGNFAWFTENAETKTHQVAKKQPNGYGLYDMSGNVVEWCWDLFEVIEENANLGQDPTGADSGSGRIMRSSSWFDDTGHCKRAFRSQGTSFASGSSIGFRLVAYRPYKVNIF